MRRRLVVLLGLLLAALGAWSLLRPRPPAAKPPAVVPIQDGKTLDFSSGKPVVKDSAAARAELGRAVKAMDAAAASVTFTPAGNRTVTPK